MFVTISPSMLGRRRMSCPEDGRGGDCFGFEGRAGGVVGVFFFMGILLRPREGLYA